MDNIVLLPNRTDLKIIKDGRTLRGLSNKGYFDYPVTKGQAYINNIVNGNYVKNTFTYKGISYIIKYCSGCFYPFLFKIE